MDRDGETQADRDAEWAEHIAGLRAREVAERTGRTPEEVREGWAAEGKAKAGPQPVPKSLLASEFEIDSEMRGETIHYIEPTRRTQMMFFWTQGYEIHAHTLKTWSHPAGGGNTPVTPEERAQVIRRVVEWARNVQGVTLKVV